jgi:glucose/arabinose dehydrogenase
MTTAQRVALRLALYVLTTPFVLLPVPRSQAQSLRASVAPAKDSADIPFRRVPMGSASRSIVVSLATNLHLAFDATLLRTHTVWEGESLNLYGPPFNGSATRFICDFTGNPLWEHLPIQPWELERAVGAGFNTANARFVGVSTQGGKTSFLYELLPVAGVPIKVRETPRFERVLSNAVVVRRIEIAPLAAPVRFSAFHGPGAFVRLPGVEGAFAIRREKDFLLVASRALQRTDLTARRDDAAQIVPVHGERDGKGPYSVVVTNTISGPHAQISLLIPASANNQVVEIAMAICAEETVAVGLAKAFVSAPGALRAGEDGSHRLSNSSSGSRPRDAFTFDSTFADKRAGDDSFAIEHFPVPKEIKLLVGGIDFLPNGDLAVCTYAGDVWIVEGATGGPTKAGWRRFARGLNEPGGLRVIDGQIHVQQKCELTRVLDTDADGEADLFECVSDGWGYAGNYHSYATGPALDAAGNLYVMITGHRAIYDVPFMGWCVRISRESQTLERNAGALSPARSTAGAGLVAEGFCSGLRVPNGFGEFNGDIFMTDNQGHWIPANKLNHLQVGKFYGHPSALPAARDLFNGNPNFTPPAVWFPYAWVRSASGIAPITDERLGPFKGQMLVGEFQNASVMRVALEKVNGQWQGAVFPFVKGFASGVNRIVFGPDGKLYAGGLRMGHWTSIAPQPHSLDRVSFTGKMPFEIRDAHAQPDGFTLTFTQAVDAATAGDLENWDATQYTYAYDGRHNAPEKDRDEKIPGPSVRVTKAVVSPNRESVRLQIEGCQPRHVIMVRALDVKNAAGQPLRHDTFHYTLNEIPAR